MNEIPIWRRGLERRPEYLQFYLRHHCRLPLWEVWEKASIPDLNHGSIFILILYLCLAVLNHSWILQECLSSGHSKRPVLAFMRRLAILMPHMLWLPLYVSQLYACSFILSIFKFSVSYSSFVSRFLQVHFIFFRCSSRIDHFLLQTMYVSGKK